MHEPPFAARPLTVAILGSSLLLLSACGGGGGGSEVATLGAAADSGATTTVAVDGQEAWLSFAQCMRDNGVDMQDPTFDANGNVQGGFGPDSGIDFRDDATGAALDACRERMPSGGPGSGAGPQFDRTAIEDAFNEFTGCLRDEGLDVDDIDLPAGPSGDGPPGSAPPGSIPAGAGGSVPAGGFRGGPPPSDAGGEGFDPTARIVEQLGLDADDPAVSAAVEACSASLEGAFAPAGGASTTTGS
jgi:hypothetical protein